MCVRCGVPGMGYAMRLRFQNMLRHPESLRVALRVMIGMRQNCSGSRLRWTKAIRFAARLPASREVLKVRFCDATSCGV